MGALRRPPSVEQLREAKRLKRSWGKGVADRYLSIVTDPTRKNAAISLSSSSPDREGLPVTKLRPGMTIANSNGKPNAVAKVEISGRRVVVALRRTDGRLYQKTFKKEDKVKIVETKKEPIWRKDGSLGYLDTGEECRDPDILIEHYRSLIEVRQQYIDAGYPDSVAEKEEQMAWIAARLPFKIYSTEEVERLARLLNSTVPPEGGVWESGGARVEPLGGDLWKVREPNHLPLDRLSNHPYNSLIYGDSEDVSDLVVLIRESRWIKKITINLDGEAIGGNRRLLAARELEWPEPIAIEILRLPKEKEIERLVLDNASRQKSREQMGREAQVLLDTPGWIEKQRAIAKKAGTNVKSLKTRDILARQVGIGSGYTLDKAIQVCRFIDTHPEHAEFLRGLLNDKSVSAAHEEMEKLEKGDRLKYTGKRALYDIDGEEITADRDVVLNFAPVKLDDPNRVMVRIEGKEGSSIECDRRDLDVIPADKPESPTAPPKLPPATKDGPALRPKKFKPLDRVCRKKNPGWCGKVQTWDDGSGAWLVRWEGKDAKEEWIAEHELSFPPLYGLGGDRVRFVYRARAYGEIRSVSYVPGQGCWMYSVIRDDGQREDVREDHLELVADNPPLPLPASPSLPFAVGDWVSDGHSWAIVREVGERAIDLHYLGMGEIPAPLEGSGKIGKDDEAFGRLQKVKFDPFKPPARVLRYLKAGDLVVPSWKRDDAGEVGEIVSRSGDRGDFTVRRADGEEIALGDAQLLLVRPALCPLKRGDRVRLKFSINYPAHLTGFRGKTGRILNIYRTVADIRFDGDPVEKVSRFPIDWLDRDSRSFLECESEEDVKQVFTRMDTSTLMDAAIELWKAWKGVADGEG